MLWGVFGNTGMLGSDLEQVIVSSGHKIIGFNRSNLDLSNSPSELAQKISSHGQFDVLVNCVAYTAVDKAESEPDKAMLVNGEYAGKLALVAREIEAKFVHISTDYVFDGTANSPYKPTDIPNPQSAYGKSKLSGELAVQESGVNYQIFRTAWLYGASGQCFPRAVQRVLSQEGSMNVVADQIGQPTWTVDLAKLIIAHAELEHSNFPKIVHATASGQASWFEFAKEIARSLGYNPDGVIHAITTADYPTPAKRPAFSVLESRNETGLVIGDWKARWQVAADQVLGLGN